MKKRIIVLGVLLAMALLLAFSLAVPAAGDTSPVFDNPDYVYKQLLDTGESGIRWPDYNAAAGKITWYESGYVGYFADYDANTLELSNVTALAPDKKVYIPTFSKDGQYIYYQDVDDTHKTSIVVTSGTIQAHPSYRYNIAEGTTDLIFDISTIAPATIEALTDYIGNDFGFYLGPTESNDAVLMCVRDGNGQMDIVRYNINDKTFVNLTDSEQAEYDGRYFGTDTSKLLYWTESFPDHSIRNVAILSGGVETVITSTTKPDMYLSSRWGEDQNHVMTMKGTGWSANDLVMFTYDGAEWSGPEDLTGDGWSYTDGGINVGAWVGNGFIYGVRDCLGVNGLWVAMEHPGEVWVDDDYDPETSGGHAWGYDAFNTIQDGIDAAADGGTVNVASGTYNENLNIDKSLTLQGEDAETTTISGTGSTVVTINADVIKIDGFTVTNGGQPGMGIYTVDHSNLTITNNIVTDIGNDGDDVRGQGIVIISSSAPVDNIDISYNVINDIQSGLRTGSSSKSTNAIAIGWSNGDEDVTNLVIHDNVISDIKADTSPWADTKGQGANGIFINHAGPDYDGRTVNAQIYDNTITDLEGLWAHAIGLEGNTPNAVVQGNTISGLTSSKLIHHPDQWNDAVAVMVEDNPSANTVAIKYNKFSDIAYGVVNVSVPEYVNATKNYWGTDDDTIIAGMVGGAVAYDPYYDSEEMTNLVHNKPVYNTTPDKDIGYDSIQVAIDNANEDDILTVVAETHIEGQVVIDKDLTITGDPDNKPVIQPLASLTGNNAGDAWFLVQPGVLFNLNNVVLDGADKWVHQAIRSHGESLIDNVDFRNIQGSLSGQPYRGIAIESFGGTVPGGAGSDSHGGGGPNSYLIVSECTFQQIGRIGILVKGTGAGAQISLNTYTGKGDGDWLDYGIEAGAGAGPVMINGNTITGNIGVASVDGSTSAAVLVTTYYGAGTDADLDDNTLTGNTDGIAVGYDENDTSSVSAHGNDLSGNEHGIYSTAPSVYGQGNWWGSVNGPTHASNTFNVGAQGAAVSDYVLFTPWLDSTPDDPDCDIFAPVIINNIIFDGYASIQAAIDAANDGDTVTAAAGTFSETVIITKPIVLEGAQADVDARDRTGVPESIIVSSAPNGTIQVGPVLSDSVVIDGFTIINNSTGPNGNGIQAVERTVELIVANNIIDSRYVIAEGPEAGYGGNGINFWRAVIAIAEGNYILQAGTSGITAGDDAGTPDEDDGIKTRALIVGNKVRNSHFGITGYQINSIIAGNEVYWEGEMRVPGAGIGGQFYDTEIFENEIYGYDKGAGLAFNRPYTVPNRAVSEDVVASYNVIHNNQFGVYVNQPLEGMDIGVFENAIYGNAVYGAVLDPNDDTGYGPGASGILNAPGNWWGDASGPGHAVTNPSGLGNAVSDGVDYTPWWGADYVDDDHLSAWTWRTNDSIQDAIDAAYGGDMVSVSAGTYPAGLVIDKPLSIIGSGPSSTFVTGGIVIAGSSDWSSLLLKDLYLKGDYSGNAKNALIDLYGAPTVSDFTIQGCVLDGEGVPDRMAFYGANHYSGDWTWEGNEIKGFRDWLLIDNTSSVAPSGVQHALDTVVFSDNWVHDCYGSISFRGKPDDKTDSVIVTGNTFEEYPESALSQAWAAIEVNIADSLEMYGNTIDGVPEVSWGGEGQAVQIWGIDTIDIHDNIFANCFQGIWVFGGESGGIYGGPYPIPSGAIYDNSILGNTDYGIAVEDTATGSPLVVTRNWWGTANGNGIRAMVKGRVIYAPWYADESMTTTVSDLPVHNLTQDTDHATIQEAIDFASEGDTISVDAETYGENIVIDKEIILLGAQHDVDPAGSTDRGSESIITGQVEITAGATFNGFKLDGNRVYIHDASGAIASYNIIINSTMHGVYIDGSSPGTQVLYNTISNPAWQGIVNEGSSNVIISHNHITGVDTEQPIECTSHAGTGIQITYNIISGCTNNKGINYWGGPGPVISYNQISGTAHEAIFSDTKTNTIEGNIISNIEGAPGINLYPCEVANSSEKSIISSNQISNTKWQGICVLGQAYTEITGNILSNCNYYGADGTGDWDYAGIHVEDCGGSSAYCLIDGNTVTDGINGIQVWSSHCTITNNTVANMGVTYADTKTVDADTYWNSGIIIGGIPGIGVSPTGTVIENNTLTGNVVGIYIHYAVGNEARFNNISGSVRYGIENADTNMMDAIGNWWGSTSGPGTAVSTNVDYSPWWGANYVDSDHSTPWTWYTNDSIQDTINAADDGDTINVLAGTYNENINIDKSLTVLGANHGVNATAEERGPESIIDAQGLTLGVLINGTGTIATFDGFTVKNYARGGIVAGTFSTSFGEDADTAHILNNIVHPPITQQNNNCIQIGDGTTGTVVGNKVMGAYLESPDWSGSGILVSGSSNVVISHNYVYDCEGGIQIQGYAEYRSAPAENNIIEYNILENNETAISVQGNSIDIIIRYNDVLDNDIGVASLAYDISWPEHSTPTGTDIYGNDIAGSVNYGVRSSVWGNNTGTVLAEEVDIPDILTSNTFDRAVTVKHEGVLLLSIWSSIQDAIDTAVDNDTVNVAPGMYPEAITINKSLTLRGATYSINKNGYAVPAGYAWDETVESIIVHPDPAAGYNNIVNIEDVDNVTFEGFIVQELNAIDNLNSSLVRVYAHTREITNIVVRNNIIGPNTNVAIDDGTDGRMGLYIVNHPYSDEYGVVNSTFSGNKIFDCKGNGNNVFIWSSYKAYGAAGPVSMAGTVIENNEIYGAHRSGIETAGGISDLVIRNNKVYDCGGATMGTYPDIMYGNGILMIRGSGDRDNVDGYGPVNITIENNVIYNNGRHGIYMEPNNNGINIRNNTIRNNGGNGILVDLIGNYWNPLFETTPGPHTNLGGSQNIVARFNLIYNNTGFGARVNGEPTNGFRLNATYNWWGVKNATGVAAKVSGAVNYDPWHLKQLTAGAIDAAKKTTTSVILSWTAEGIWPSDYYDFRYSTSPLTSDAAWAAAKKIVNEPAPAEDTTQQMIIRNLDANTTYYFGLVITDGTNRSDIRTVQAKTDALVALDTTPPAAVSNLAVSAGEPATTSVRLSWTATGDDGSTGFASKYIIKRSTAPISAADFDTATTIFNSLTPKASGQPETFTVTRLNPNTTYYFAIKVQDERPNTSGISNIVSIITAAELPTVTGITADVSGTHNGEARNITVTGTNLQAGTAIVRLVKGTDVIKLTNVIVDGNTQIRATVPKGVPTATYKARVINNNGTSALGGTYTVTQAPQPIPVVTNAIPNLATRGTAVNGVEIFGKNFNGATAVTINGHAATIVTVNSATKITVNVPGLSVGEYNLKVTTPAGTNDISAVKFIVREPVVINIDTTEDTTTSDIVTLDTNVIPVQITLTTDNSQNATRNTDSDAEIEVVIPPDTSVTDSDGNPYTGTLNPPRVVKPDPTVHTELPEEALVIEMGNPDKTIRFDQDFVTTVTVTSTSLPQIYYYNKDTGKYELAGKTGTKDGITYMPGGVVLNVEIISDSENVYTIGLLLDHMSVYVASTESLLPPRPAPSPGGGGGGAPPSGTTNVRGKVSLTGRFLETVIATTMDGTCRLTIPFGTAGLDKDLKPLTQITMLTTDVTPSLPEDWNVIGLVYDFGPSGASFDPAITLSWKYNPEDLPVNAVEEELILAYYDAETGEWVAINSTVDTKDKTVTAKITHFTTFAMVNISRAASFTVSSLKISPAVVNSGETVTVTSTVTNTGTRDGSYMLVLRINGIKEAEKSVTVAVGTSKDVSFNVIKEAAGTYSIELNGLTGSLTVKSKLSPEPTQPPEPGPEPGPEPEPMPTPEPSETPLAPTQTTTPGPATNWAIIWGAIAIAVVVIGGTLAILWSRRRRA